MHRLTLCLSKKGRDEQDTGIKINPHVMKITIFLRLNIYVICKIFLHLPIQAHYFLEEY